MGQSVKNIIQRLSSYLSSTGTGEPEDPLTIIVETGGPKETLNDSEVSEVSSITSDEILQNILQELKKMNVYNAMTHNTTIRKEDV